MPGQDIINSQLTPAIPVSHDLGGIYHAADTLADLNAKVSDATLIDTADTRIPVAGVVEGDGLHWDGTNWQQTSKLDLLNSNYDASDWTEFTSGDGSFSASQANGVLTLLRTGGTNPGTMTWTLDQKIYALPIMVRVHLKYVAGAGGGNGIAIIVQDPLDNGNNAILQLNGTGNIAHFGGGQGYTNFGGVTPTTGCSGVLVVNGSRYSALGQQEAQSALTFPALNSYTGWAGSGAGYKAAGAAGEVLRTERELLIWFDCGSGNPEVEISSLEVIYMPGYTWTA